MVLKQRPYGRVYYFGKRKEEMRRREMGWQSLGGIDPEWDAMLDAELEIASPAATAVPSREG
jgi:hypothetical protein